MKIDNILVMNNELMDAGRIDEQIIQDFNRYLTFRKKHQKKLDEIKEIDPKNYRLWTENNQKKIQYVKRILELVSR